MTNQWINEASLAALPPATPDERTMAILAHLLQTFTGFIAPLIIFCVKQDSRFVKFHALQSLVWQLVYMAVFFVAMMAFFLSVFLPAMGGSPHQPPPTALMLFPLIWLLGGGGWVLNVAIGIVYALKANRGEWAPLPVIGRWFLPKPAVAAEPIL